MSNSSKIIQVLEKRQMMEKQLPDFKPGDTVVVKIKVSDGNRTRLQSFEGFVIAKKNRGLNSSFTVRKMSHGVGVERCFQSYSHLIAEVVVKRRGSVRQAKIYYMRDRQGKAARIREKL